MNEMIEKCRGLTDAELMRELKFHSERERRNMVGLLIHLAEFDRRRLAQKESYPSTFWYCHRVLRYDEGGAYRRIHAARVIRRYPHILPEVAEGSLTLTSLLLLSPLLTEENHDRLFIEAKGKSKRELEVLIAKLNPIPASPDAMRRLPAPPPWHHPGGAVVGVQASDQGGGPPSGELAEILPSRPPSEWQAVIPLSVDRVRIGFDAALVVMSLIERARQVLRHKFPDGRLEDILREALEILLDRKDPQRKFILLRNITKATPAAIANASNEPRFLRVSKNGRYIPARVKSAVWQRDDGRCAWRFEDGTLCGSKDCLEYDHIRPYAQGGRSDDPRNVRLLCRRHNQAAALAAGLKPAPASA